MAVAAIKVGAFDFIEKPFDEARLLASIRNAIEAKQQPEIDGAEVENLRSRFSTLSARQRQVMELAVAGLSNKEIGSQLKISPKTVENHRAWVMERIGARTSSANVARADALHHPGTMILDRLRADLELRSDFLVGQARNGKLHDLALPG